MESENVLMTYRMRSLTVMSPFSKPKSPILGFGISLDFCVVMGFVFRGTGYDEL